MLEISKLSSKYNIYRLDESNLDEIFNLCLGNTLYYKYCEASPSKDQIIKDLNITPEGIELKDKYYIGFYKEDKLIAVMDLIDGYPKKEYCFIGFFMMNNDYQGKEIGSFIINEVSEYLKSINKEYIQLGIDKDNPQSKHFWSKNGFKTIKEINRDGHIILYAQKTL